MSSASCHSAAQRAAMNAARVPGVSPDRSSNGYRTRKAHSHARSRTLPPPVTSAASGSSSTASTTVRWR